MELFNAIQDMYSIEIAGHQELKRRLLNPYYIVLTDDAKRCFLKSYSTQNIKPLESKNFDRMAGITEYLMDHDVFTPRIIKTNDGNNCAKIDNYWYVLFEYFQQDPSFNMKHKIGECVSKVHGVLQKTKMKPFDSWSLHIGNVQEIKDIFLSVDNYLYGKRKHLYLEEEMYLKNHSAIKNLVIGLDDYICDLETSLKRQFIHGDLHIENIVTNEYHSGVIDLDTCHFGFIVEDYTVLIRDLFFRSEHRINSVLPEYISFRNQYTQRSCFNAEMVYRGMLYCLIKDLATLLINWKLTSRFEITRKLARYFIEQINYLQECEHELIRVL